MRGQGIFEWAQDAAWESNGWFGPGRPMAPGAPGAAGRRWNYPVALNQRYGPKAGEGVTFDELRVFADLYDLLRLVIETRKDEMELFEWKVQDKGGKDTAAARKMQGLLCSPDGEHTWHQWQRTLLEELFVTDAPAIYVRRTVGGDPFALEIIDGGTIKRLIDSSGRTPAEGPAYQQVLHGIVAADFDRSELIYCPRNLRVNRVYGYSPVEQVITTVNIALRRQQHQLSYYTEGSVPDLMFQVPEGWDARQIAEFQTWWASLFSEGNIANRRMARFVPHGVTPFNTKEAALKDTYDEWLARIICFAFSVSPQALVAQMNRSTAEVAEETAKSSGLEPIKFWLKGVMDRILRDVYGEPGLEFAWLPKDSIDPEAQARIHATYVQCGIMDANEAREAIGLGARKGPAPFAGAQGGLGAIGTAGLGVTGGPGAGMPTGAGVPPAIGAAGAAVQDTALNGAQVASLVQIVEAVVGGTLPKAAAAALIGAAFPSLSREAVAGIVGPLEAGPGPSPGQPRTSEGAGPAPEPMAKAGPMDGQAPGTLRPIDRGRPALAALEGALADAVDAGLRAQRGAVAEYLAAPRVAALFGMAQADAAVKLAKGDRWEEILAALDLGFDPYGFEAVEDALARIAQEGGAAGLDQLREKLTAAQGAARDQLVSQVNQRARAWAKARAGELIKEISETTRRGVAGLVAKGIEDGWSIDELAARVHGDKTFDPARAQLIAHTELAFADVAGNKLAYLESGVVRGLQWQTANGGGDERTCGACEMNHGAVVPLGPDGRAARPYPSGAMQVPAHPRCLCDEWPYLGEVE